MSAKLEAGFEIKGKKIKKILHTFRVWWEGWECDDVGWIVEFEDGVKSIVVTSHGSHYIEEESFLTDKIKEYHDVISSTELSLKILPH